MKKQDKYDGTPTENVIEIRNLNKTYGKGRNAKNALHDINLDIKKGEIYGIIGLSGAGKSTLVRCINGLEKYDGGSLKVGGQEVRDLDQKSLRGLRRKVGMIFQSFNLVASKTVTSNVEMPLLNNTVNKTDRGKRVKELLQLVGLEDKADSYPSELSGGQKQRVAIARALANNPEVLLSDEATSALDPNTTRSILKLLRRLRDELGLTIIIITHQMSVIREICDHVSVIDRGTIVEGGTVFNVFANPKDDLTKSFVNTTSNLGKIWQLIEENSPLTDLAQGQKLIQMRYCSKQVSEALISQISRRFDIDANIVFGDIDVIDEAPIGGLVVILDGSETNISQAIEYLKDRNISIAILREG